MNLVEWISANLPIDSPFVCAIALGFLVIVVHDFYSLLFSAIFSIFKK